MVDCLNPACSSPENPGNSSFCQSCGVPLNVPYLFEKQYRVTQLLGQGAFGRTYLAEDTKCLNRPCVIKKFIAQGQGAVLKKAKELFVREAQRLYELDHPQIPRLYAYFEENNSLYLIQEYIAGENLLEEGLQRQYFREEEVRDLLESLLPVLQYVHAKSVLHRDIKPENIMRKVKVSGRAQFVLIDFGGAKQSSGLTQAPGTCLYTPGYAAQEHALGKAVAASDIYSLGATCVRLLTGSFPKPDLYGEIEDNLYDSLEGRWRWREHLQQQSRTADNRFGEILDKMLQPFVRDRYQSAAEVLAALNSLPNTLPPQPPVINPPAPSSPPAPPQPAAQPSSPPAQPQPAVQPAAKPQPISRAKFLQLMGAAGGVITVAWLGEQWLDRRESPISVVQPVNSPSGSPVQPVNSPSGSPVQPVNSPSGSPSNSSFSFKVLSVNDRGEVVNRQQRSAEYFSEELGRGVGLEMVAIPGGSFLMGSPETEEKRRGNENPHQVTIQPFYMGKTAVTQAQWQAVAALPKVKIDLKPDPSWFKGANRPVEWVNWWEAEEFCKRLSQKTGKEYRLPSEAEWEYACRAGTTTPFHFGETITPELVNYDGDFPYGNAPEGEYRGETVEVGSLPPNGFGLFEMHGNVREWCADHWHKNYQGAPSDGTIWLSGDENNRRLLRGGSWFDNPRSCRSAIRIFNGPVNLLNYVNGFRVVCVAPRTL